MRTATDLPAVLADLADERCGHFTERYGPLPADANFGAALRRTFACSEFALRVAMRDGDWLLTEGASLSASPPPVAELPELADLDPAAGDVAATAAALRKARNRFLFRLLWRELNAAPELDETLRALSDLADRCIAIAAATARASLLPRFGQLRDAEGRVVPLLVVGMGKLGGRELNFSSDVDLVFLYPDDGESDGRRRLSAAEYLGRQIRAVVAMLDDVTADGFVFRVDTRLRPFGDSGPPVVSFAALESYLLQHGRDWERYAWLKARLVGPDPGDAAERAFYDELVRPFVFRRYIDYGVFEGLRDMHRRISDEVRRRERADDIKLGPGGIREIEFIVQSLQLVRGGSRPELRRRNLRNLLPALAESRGFDAAAASELDTAYCFLRRLENFIQARNDRQEHALPADGDARLQLAVAMGCADADTLVAALDEQRDVVTAQFERVAFTDEADVGDGPVPVDPAAAQIADDYLASPGVQRIDAVAGRRLERLMPRLVAAASSRASPEAVMRRALSVVDSVLRRSAYIALLNENPAALERLAELTERSSAAVRQLVLLPVLLDELLDPRAYAGMPSRADVEADLAARLAGSDAADLEQRMEVLAQFQRVALFRTALADLLGGLPLMKVSDRLTEIAELTLATALDAAWNELCARHGAPRQLADGGKEPADFVIIAYGKLGGLELSYGSDLDLVFLHGIDAAEAPTDGEKPIDSSVFFVRLVRRLVHFLTTRTQSGVLYEIDTRLRPSGRKGLLVTSLPAFRRYQQDEAWTWEHQALLRARPVAGSAALGERFVEVRREILCNAVRRDRLQADVVAMRAKMRAELDRSTGESFDLKQGAGGIGDIEFLVQYLVLAHASEHPALIEFTDNIRQLDALAAADILPAHAAARLQDIYRDYRRRVHALALDEAPATVPPAGFETLRAEVIDMWTTHLGGMADT